LEGWSAFALLTSLQIKDGKSNMKIETKFTHDKVRFDKTNDIHLVVSLKAPKLDWEAKRPTVMTSGWRVRAPWTSRKGP